ncbi:Ras-related protein [Drosera capensis]
MATQLGRAREDYDYLVKLLLIGDSGVGKSCLLLRFSDSSLTTIHTTTIGAELDIWNTLRVERMIILLPWSNGYFADMRNWMRSIEQHASDNVNKVLIGNKADMDESKRSAMTNLNVEEVFSSIARDIKQRLAHSDSKTDPTTIKINATDSASVQAHQKSACCGS